jgi:hypothetical protein
MARCRPYTRRQAGRSLQRCSSREPHGLLTFEGIVDAYKSGHRRGAREQMYFYAAQRPLTKAVRVAALCLDECGKRHDHQRRIRRGLLSEAERRLQARQEELAACATFDELFESVCEVVGGILGIGRRGVTAYDIATRIGASRGLKPAYIYLHCGTLEGARTLGLRGRKLSRDQFPEAFRALTPAELEDCLCIFKNELRTIGGRAV